MSVLEFNQNIMGMEGVGNKEQQAEAVTSLSEISTKLADIKAMLEKWGEPADMDYLGTAWGAINALHNRLSGPGSLRPRK